MNAYETAQRLNITGTPEQIVDKLKPLTVADIPIMSVRTWFREKSLWLERSTGEMFGPLQTAYDVASQPQKDGLDYLYDTVFAGSAQYLRTTDPVWAAKVWELVQLVVTLSPQASGLVDSFYALDGGRPYAWLTVEQYNELAAAAQTAAEKDAAVAAVVVKCNAAREAAETEARTSQSTRSTIAAAAESAWRA
jgi:hypothetical protein